MSQDVFISYSRVDLPFVERLNAFLKNAGVGTWFDRERLLPGQRWEDVIDDEITASKLFMTCLSKGGMDKRGFFHVEQRLALDAALRVPPETLFVLPVLLGDCEVPRQLRQYHFVNVLEFGAIEMLLASISSGLGRAVAAAPDAIATLREDLLAHLGTEGASNSDFVDRFMQTEELSFQDSMGLIERIANSSDSNRLSLLLKLRGIEFISYAEQAALDLAIKNVKSGERSENLQATIKAREMEKILQMGIPGNAGATQLLQLNKYVRYVSRKNTQPYEMTEKKIANLLAGRD